MASFVSGPTLRHEVSNLVLNKLAPDPGALAAGALMSEVYFTRKRKRLLTVSSLVSTAAEKRQAVVTLHKLEHRAMHADGIHVF